MGGHVVGVHVHLVPYPHVALSVPTLTYQTVWYVPTSGSALESWAKARKRLRNAPHPWFIFFLNLFALIHLFNQDIRPSFDPYSKNITLIVKIVAVLL